MTKEEILAMEVGEELSRAITEIIFQECWHEPVGGIYDKHCYKCKSYDYKNKPCSTDISAAWLVVEKLEELGFYFKLDSWQVEFYASGRDMDKNVVKFDGLTPKLVCPAVCRAALLTMLGLK